MSNYEDDIEPIADPGDKPSAVSLGKRPRDEQDEDQQQALRNSRLSPEPDEDLDTSLGRHQVWLVKVPKFLIQGWGSIKKDDLRLGTVRVYDPDHTGHQRMELLLPDAPQSAIPSDGNNKSSQWNHIPRVYDLKLTSDSVSTMKRNLFAFKEKLQEAEPASGSGTGSGTGSGRDDSEEATRRKGKARRLTALSGTVTNEASLQPKIRAGDSKPGSSGFIGNPAISDEYRELLRKRREEASKPKRTIKMLDASDAGRNNMLVAGVGAGLSASKSRFNAFISQKPKAQQTEKFARMPRNELLDMLFSLFEKWQYWSLKKLRSETQQPESYLRDVLSTIADLHKRGPYVGNYSLKPEFSNMRKEQEIQGQQRQAEGSNSASAAAQKMEEDNGGDDDDDDDDGDEDDDGEDFDDVL